MALKKTLGLAMLALMLASCGTARKNLEDENAYLVGAEPLDDKLVSDEALQKRTSNTRSYIGLIAYDSQKKCARFVTSLVLAENSVNTGFDLATILFSALATVFTPLNTVHALSGAASISSGWRSAINSDIYAKATIGNYAQAILATYYKDIGEYVAVLDKADEKALTASIEVVRIQAIHRECTLAAAQATISATLQPSGPPEPGAIDQDTLQVTGTLPGGGNISLSATSRALSTYVVSVPYMAKPADTVVDIAAGLLAAVNNDDALKAAGIKAVQANEANPNGTIILQSPASAGVIWSTNQLNIIKLTIAPPTTSKGAGISAGAGTAASAVSAPPVVVPGRKIR